MGKEVTHTFKKHFIVQQDDSLTAFVQLPHVSLALCGVLKLPIL